jgi:hypothetical protein
VLAQLEIMPFSFIFIIFVFFDTREEICYFQVGDYANQEGTMLPIVEIIGDSASVKSFGKFSHSLCILFVLYRSLLLHICLKDKRRVCEN